jgi:UDP:flavonoid glycosyltransferase YjiC (YdhE family)
LSRILLFAEAVTLAHVARPIALSRILRGLGHEVRIAASQAADRWLASEDVPRERIESIAPAQFLRALSRGAPAYDRETLDRYVEADLAAMSRWRPDVVIGDFRLSLYISARLAHVRYGAIANAYWSRRYWPGAEAPSVPVLSMLPRPAANLIFRTCYPAAFALHALPFHRTCSHFGVAPPRLDIRDVYTASDATAFADVHAFYERSSEASDASQFIGPLAWEPSRVARIPDVPPGAPVIFISIGSSGDHSTLPMLIDAVRTLPVRCIVAAGEHPSVTQDIANCVHRAELVSYAEASAIATLVICNGGAPATYAALRAGRPVIGLVRNLDQVLNMRVVERLHAGITVHPERVDSRSISLLVQNALRDERLLEQARAVARTIGDEKRHEEPIRRWLAALLAIPGAAAEC